MSPGWLANRKEISDFGSKRRFEMVSLELIRRYPFFAGLSLKQIAILAQAASEESAEAGYCFFQEGEKLKFLYMNLVGTRV